METLTIAQASERTGLSQKALARRIERGTIPAIQKDGKRRIPLTALEQLPRKSPEGAGMGESYPQGYHGAAIDLSPLLNRLEQQAAELARLRLLTEQTASTEQALKNELHQARAKIKELEHQAQAEQKISTSRRGWFRRSRAEQAEP